MRCRIERVAIVLRTFRSAANVVSQEKEAAGREELGPPYFGVKQSISYLVLLGLFDVQNQTKQAKGKEESRSTKGSRSVGGVLPLDVESFNGRILLGFRNPVSSALVSFVEEKL